MKKISTLLLGIGLLVGVPTGMTINSSVISPSSVKDSSNNNISKDRDENKNPETPEVPQSPEQEDNSLFDKIISQDKIDSAKNSKMFNFVDDVVQWNDNMKDEPNFCNENPWLMISGFFSYIPNVFLSDSSLIADEDGNLIEKFTAQNLIANGIATATWNEESDTLPIYSMIKGNNQTYFFGYDDIDLNGYSKYAYNINWNFDGELSLQSNTVATGVNGNVYSNISVTKNGHKVATIWNDIEENKKFHNITAYEIVNEKYLIQTSAMNIFNFWTGEILEFVVGHSITDLETGETTYLDRVSNDFLTCRGEIEDIVDDKTKIMKDIYIDWAQRNVWHDNYNYIIWVQEPVESAVADIIGHDNLSKTPDDYKNKIINALS